MPWNNLSSKPVELFIDTICLVLSLEEIHQWYSQKSYIEFCTAIIEGIKSEMSKKLEEEFEKQDKKATFFEQIFDNLVISVKNIHVRVESPFGQETGLAYSLGGILEDFMIRSVDEAGSPIFVKRVTSFDRVTKTISFKNLSLYHDSKTIQQKDVSIIDYWFKSKNAEFQKIVTLNLDIMFTLNPFNQATKEVTTPIYQLRTDINQIEITFDTVMIRDISGLLDYFNQYKQSELEFLEKQKYNYLKPVLKIRNATKSPDEKRKCIRDWFKFSLAAVKRERRSKLSGVVLSNPKKENKARWREDITTLFLLREEGKLKKEQEGFFNWLIQLFSLKDLTEIVKKASYEQFKLSRLG